MKLSRLMRAPQLVDLIALVYDAAADPGRWSACLAALGEAVRCPALGLFPIEPGSTRFHATLSVGHDPDLLARFDAYYGRPEVNAYTQHIERSMLVPGTVLRADAVCPDRELRRSEYFEDWLRPQGLGAGGFAMLGAGGRPIVLSLARAPARGHLDGSETALVRALLPHLQRAVTLRDHFAALEAEREAVDAALDAVEIAVILVDTAGRPLLLNRRARALVAEGDGLGLARDGLSGARAETTAALRRLVADAARTGEGRGTAAGGEIALPRPSGRRALMALVTPLARGRWRAVREVAAAAVLVSDPDAGAPPAEALSRMWKLTPAEAALARELAAGRRVQEIAEARGVRITTLRTHLARIFSKTGARRQAELVQLLLTGVPPLSR